MVMPARLTAPSSTGQVPGCTRARSARVRPAAAPVARGPVCGVWSPLSSAVSSTASTLGQGSGSGGRVVLRGRGKRAAPHTGCAAPHGRGPAGSVTVIVAVVLVVVGLVAVRGLIAGAGCG